jgi:GWxTD domain-containing protein
MSASLLALLSVVVGAIDFSVDWSAFRAGGDSSRIEFFYSIPFDQLAYTQTDSGLVAPFSVRLDLQGVENGFREQGTVLKRARIRDFEEAAKAQRSFVDGFSVVAPAGRYRFEMVVSETTAEVRNLGEFRDSFDLSGFSKGLSLSSLQIGSSAIVDTQTGAVSVIPNPTHRFPEAGLEAVYVYYEGYNLSPDSEYYEVKAAITSVRAGKVDTVVNVPALRRKKSGTTASYALGVSADGVGPGGYTLALELTDLATKSTTKGFRRFTVGTPEEPAAVAGFKPDTLPPLERKYYDQIQYIATARQVAYYKALSDSGKVTWLAKFWQTRYLAEFSRRMETAAERFRMPRRSGLETDRGRVYVKYGEPDAIDQKVIETETRPREYWHYYANGLVFIFVDVRSDGNFRLAWTNSKDEPPTGFEGYLTTDEIEEFR